jgi:hypothetical protein
MNVEQLFIDNWPAALGVLRINQAKTGDLAPFSVLHLINAKQTEKSGDRSRYRYQIDVYTPDLDPSTIKALFLNIPILFNLEDYNYDYVDDLKLHRHIFDIILIESTL